MKSKSFFGAGSALLFLTVSATAGPVPLILTSSSYNFQLAGGGGGASATLNGVPVEIFCDNFYNEIYVPSSNSADVTTLGTGANLSETRFGGVAQTAWTTITLSDGNTSLDNTDNAFFNNPSGPGTTALARYEMVADLVSLYNVSQGGTTANNQIQEAIWTLMDPAAQGPVIDPSGVNPDNYLEQAAGWYMANSGNQIAMNNFLSGFEVISDPSMTFSNGLGQGGFQEQIVMATPEPRGTVWMVLCIVLGGFVIARRTRLTSAPAMNS
jgi:hypothetical protein